MLQSWPGGAVSKSLTSIKKTGALLPLRNDVGGGWGGRRGGGGGEGRGKRE